MYKTLFALAALAFACCAFSQVSTMNGTMTWGSGTLIYPVTIETTPITITLQVGNYQNTLATYMTGLPGTVLPSGTPIEFMAHGSTPFYGSYDNGSNATAFNPADGKGPAYRRTVTVGDFGALTYTVATVAGQPGGQLEFYLPQVIEVWSPNLSAYEISINGLIVIFGAPISSYNLGLPSPTTFSHGTVEFPSGSAAMNTVSFTSQGDFQLSFQGADPSTRVFVVGSVNFVPGAKNTQNPTYLSGATLSFQTGQ